MFPNVSQARLQNLLWLISILIQYGKFVDHSTPKETKNERFLAEGSFCRPKTA
jgi:hypothetical protein